MKTTIAILLTLCLCAGLCACGTNTGNAQSDDNDYSYDTPAEKTLSQSEKEEIAEEEALDSVYSTLKSSYGTKYDVSATKYKTGQISNVGDKLTVNGTLYLYDKYGSLKDTATFSVKVTVDDDGSAFANYPTIKIQ